ncbi:MAG: tetratricopeptide repeat protein [Betaproteobacteria bacterium]|nr:tetratricopeptide repeat protein [Betaproteobacteria bacterium]
MLGGLFSNLAGKPRTAAPAATPARPAPTPFALKKWLADDALPGFSEADLRAEPRRLEIADALLSQQGVNEALAGARQLLAENPQSAIDRMLLVELLLRAGDMPQALTLAQETLADSGRMGARAAAMLAERALFLGDLPRAGEMARRALAQAPDSAAAHVVLGCVLDAQGAAAPEDYPRAREHYERALALRPDSPMPRTHLAGSLLRQGLLREGMTHWVMAEILRDIYRNRDTCPVWGGQPLGTQRILMIAHSGFGDMIQCLRFAEQLREREPRAHLALLVAAPMARLAESTGWFDRVYADGIAGDEQFDWQVTQTHLPLLLALEMPDLLRTQPYLKVPMPQVRAAAGWIPAARPGHLRVGLRWAGNAGMLNSKRNVPLEACAPLFAIPGIDWVALVEDQQSAVQARGFGLAEAAIRIQDFQDSAALMCNLDLVISVDTSVANLAGALNLPTWVLSRPDPDWRWGPSGARSPWYGSARVFRHPPNGGVNWEAMIAEVVPALRAWVEENAGKRGANT